VKIKGHLIPLKTLSSSDLRRYLPPLHLAKKKANKPPVNFVFLENFTIFQFLAVVIKA
jgi:hypothetical protein